MYRFMYRSFSGFRRVFSQTALDSCFFRETLLKKQIRFFIIVHSERLGRDVFHPGINIYLKNIVLAMPGSYLEQVGSGWKSRQTKIYKRWMQLSDRTYCAVPLAILSRSSCKHPISFKLHVLSQSVDEWINKDQISNLYPYPGGVVEKWKET